MAYARRRPTADYDIPSGFDDQGFSSGFFGDQGLPSGAPTSVSPTAPPRAPTTPSPTGTFATPSYPEDRAQPGGSGTFDERTGGYQPPDDWSIYAGPTTGQSQPRQPAGAAGTPTGTPTGTATAPSPMDRYRTSVDELLQITDPMERARRADALAREVYVELQRAGHDVQWDGTTLVVDGRRYNIAGSQPTGVGGYPGASPGQYIPPGGVSGPNGPVAGGTPGAPPGAAPGGTPGGGGLSFSGFDFSRAQDPTTSAKDNFAALGQQASWMPRTKAEAEQWFNQFILPGMQAQGFKVDWVQGDKAYVRTRENPGGEEIDFLIGADGSNPQLGWQSNLAGMAGAHPGPGPTPVNGGGLLPAGTEQGAAGVVLGPNDPGFWVTLPNGQQVPYNHPLATGGEGIPGAAPPAATTDPRAGGTPPFMTAPAYKPGEITFDDIPDLNREGLLGEMGSYAPTDYQVGDLGIGPLEGDVETLLANILRNPESLDARTVAQMQVGNREDQADLLRQANDELTGLGYEYGIESSPWLAAERGTARARRDEAVQRGNREVDIEAARTNTADRRAAGQLGAAYLESKAGRKRGEEALRQSGAQMNESNRFNAARLRSDNVAQAAKLGLDEAALRGDRMALREQINQRATELGLSRDRLMTDYVTSLMDDATRRYGIDIEAELRREGFQVDRERLSQAGAEFKEELAFRVMALQEEMRYRYSALDQDREIDLTQIGLGYAGIQANQRNADRDAGFRAAGL